MVHHCIVCSESAYLYLAVEIERILCCLSETSKLVPQQCAAMNLRSTFVERTFGLYGT
jgi:hypothetical protein